MLVVGHPGHELRVHGWLERERPIVVVLTDGSGHAGISRLPSTAQIVARAGASAGTIFGRFTDAEFYRALLDTHVERFGDLVEEIASALVSEGITTVAGDDAEGYNPTHDVCRLIVNAAIERARATTRRPIANLAFLLMGRPDAAYGAADVSQVVLDADEFARKIDAALTYPEMAAEVAAARNAWGDDAFRIETFRHVPPGEVWSPGSERPFYERYGAERVKSGAYADVIRYDDHIRPLAAALAARTVPAR
jgi:AcrR family transcriptional regulator